MNINIVINWCVRIKIRAILILPAIKDIARNVSIVENIAKRCTIVDVAFMVFNTIINLNVNLAVNFKITRKLNFAKAIISGSYTRKKNAKSSNARDYTKEFFMCEFAASKQDNCEECECRSSKNTNNSEDIITSIWRDRNFRRSLIVSFVGISNGDFRIERLVTNARIRNGVSVDRTKNEVEAITGHQFCAHIVIIRKLDIFVLVRYRD